MAESKDALELMFQRTMAPHEHLAEVLKQIEGVMYRDPVEIDLDREMRLEQATEEKDAKAMSYYDDEMQSFLDSAPDLAEAISVQSDEFFKGLLKYPEILDVCKQYFHPFVMDAIHRRTDDE